MCRKQTQKLSSFVVFWVNWRFTQRLFSTNSAFPGDKQDTNSVLRDCSLSKPQGLVRPKGLGKFKIPHHRVSNPWRPIGLWDVKDSTLSRQLAHRCNFDSLTHQPHFTPQKHYFFFSMFPVLISVRGLVRPEGLGKFKISPHRVSNPRFSGF
jgi:hypothetical protein